MKVKNILWLTWKDLEHPQSGGAELVNEKIAAGLARKGYKIKLIVAGFENCKKLEVKDGYTIIRLGNKYSVYLKAYLYCKKNLLNWPDLVIDEVNAIPFFAGLYFKKPIVIFIHQLCKRVWFYQMFFPINFIGYLWEKFFFRRLSKYDAIVVSQSLKEDLMKHNFRRIHKIQNFSEIKPVDNLRYRKYSAPTILSLGSIRPMKRTMHQIQAFELAKRKMKGLKLIVAGEPQGAYGKKVLKKIYSSKFKEDIEYLGFVSMEDKIRIMRKSHLFVMTPVREGWGLVVTESNSQGTPVVAYRVNGLVDSVKDKITGVLTDQSQEALSNEIVKLLKNKKLYTRMQKSAWEDSKNYKVSTTVSNFENILKKLSY